MFPVQKDEYEFIRPPRRDRIIHTVSFLSFGAAALVTFVYLFFLIAGFRFERINGFVWFIGAFLPLVSLGFVTLLIWRKRVPVQTQQLMKKKVLPPILKTENVPSCLKIELRPRRSVFTCLILIFYIAFSLVFGYFVILDPIMWKSESIVLIWIVIVALGVPLSAFVLKRERALSLLSKTASALQLSSEGISIPIDLLDFNSQSSLIQEKSSFLWLKWEQICSWSVELGYSDEPSIYCVKTSTPRGIIHIARPQFFGKERQILDYVRIHGVTVVLKTSVL